MGYQRYRGLTAIALDGGHRGLIINDEWQEKTKVMIDISTLEIDNGSYLYNTNPQQISEHLRACLLIYFVFLRIGTVTYCCFRSRYFREVLTY